jgi:hypothetical protein
MKPLLTIPEPLQLPFKTAAAIIGVIVVAIGVYIGGVLSMYILGWILELIYKI